MAAAVTAATAATAAATATGASASPTMLLDVIVIGAGISGLYCADTLIQANPATTLRVIDGRDRVGGRLVGSVEGGVDLGASWSWPHDSRVGALAGRLGVASFPQRVDGDVILQQQRGGPTQRIGGEMGARASPCGGDAFRFAGGTAALAAGLAAGLPDGVVQLGSTVGRLDYRTGESGEQPAIRVTVTSGEGASEELLAKHVVLAAPPRVLAASIDFDPPLDPTLLKVMKATPTWMEDVGKVATTWSRPFWREGEGEGQGAGQGRGQGGSSGIAVCQEGGPVSNWWEATEEGGEPGGAALAGFVFGEDVVTLAGLSEEEAQESVREQLRAVYGSKVVESSLRSIEVKLWQNDPLTHAPLPPPSRGVDLGHPALRRRVEWGGSGVSLVFAGTESEAEHGHIEGALKAAERAAALVAEACLP